MYIIGINAAYHDSAACILKDGNLLAAREGRTVHISNTQKDTIPFSSYELPYHAINYCLEVANIHIKDVDHIQLTHSTRNFLTQRLSAIPPKFR